MLRSPSAWVLTCLIILTSAVGAIRAEGPRRGASMERVPEQAGEWLHRYATPVATGMTPADLAPILEDVRKVKVLGLGDGSHGTREFFLLKRHLIAALTTEGSVEAVVFEASPPMARRMNAWAQGAPEPPFEARRDATYWFWQSAEIADFLDDIRQHNRVAATPVEVRGSDVWDARAISAQLIQDLNAISPELGARGRSRLVCFGDPSSYWRERSAYRTACRAGLQELSNELDQSVSTSPRRIASARESMLHVLQSERVWSALPSRRLIERDLVMAENVARIARDARRQVIYWAHNGHAGMSGYPDEPQIPSAGQHLRAVLGHDYFALGTTTAHGSFRGRRGDEIVDHEVPAPPDDSWEKAFASGRASILYIPLRGTPNGLWLERDRRLFVGYAGSPPGARHELVDLRYAFDAIVYFETTNPSRGLAEQFLGGATRR